MRTSPTGLRAYVGSFPFCTRFSRQLTFARMRIAVYRSTKDVLVISILARIPGVDVVINSNYCMCNSNKQALDNTKAVKSLLDRQVLINGSGLFLEP